MYKPGELTYRGNKLWERKNKNLRWPRPVRDKSNRRLWNSIFLEIFTFQHEDFSTNVGSSVIRTHNSNSFDDITHY